MTRRRLFGTDGIRGTANLDPLTPEGVLRLGRVVATTARNRNGRARIVIGRDTRLSGPMLEAALAAGIAAEGVDVLLAGEVPTPAVAFLTRALECALGVVVSASHNPFEDNGIKIFGPDGFKLSDSQESEVEAALAGPLPERTELTGAALGRITFRTDLADRYSEFLASTLSSSVPLAGLRVVLDCANGAAYRIAPHLLQRLGATVVEVGTSPDGTNINDGCGALHPERLGESVRRERAALGIALDGDADRVVLVDHDGEPVDGDEILALLVADRARRGEQTSLVVGTVMSNVGLEVALRQFGARLLRAQVGDRWVVEEMRRHGAVLGGEPSGHVVLLERHTTGDGLLTALTVCGVMQACGAALADLRKVIAKLPQVLLSVRVARRQPLEDLVELRECVEDVERALAPNGRVLVRFSGTEPVARVMVEGEAEERVRELAQRIAATLEKELGR